MSAKRSSTSSSKPRRQRKRRRTDPDDISSVSSSSSSSPSISDDEKINTSPRSSNSKVLEDEKPKDALPSNSKGSKPKLQSKDVYRISTGVSFKDENPNQDRSRNTSSSEDESHNEELAASDSHQQSSASSPESDSEPEPEPESESRLSAESSESLPEQSQPHKSADGGLESKFENWYLRVVTQAYGDDLDKLRTEAADFKARPRDAMAMLSKALRQGVAVFGQEEKRQIIGE